MVNESEKTWYIPALYIELLGRLKYIFFFAAVQKNEKHDYNMPCTIQ